MATLHQDGSGSSSQRQIGSTHQRLTRTASNSKENEMKFKKSGAVLAVMAAVAVSVRSAGPATALGSSSAGCSSVEAVYGNSSATGSAQTWTSYSGTCGQLGVRIFYRLYAGSPTYYTSWQYGYSSVYAGNPGNTVLGGNHLARRGANSDINFNS